jgi:hypothetical protein
MERHMDVAEKETWRTATVLKDRSTLLDGKQFRNPNFASFLPHIGALNLGGKQLGVDTTRSSESTIPPDKRDNSRIRRQIVLDEIEALLVKHHPGQTAAEKKAKAELVREHFKSTSWTEISELMPLFDLHAGFNSLHLELEGEPSRYAKPIDSPAEMNDSLPDFAIAPTAEAAE